MILQDAMNKLDSIVNKPLGSILTDEQMTDIIKNKGKTGQLLELALGLRNTSTTLDFEDGELKTNKCDINGKPKETMFITQITKIIDDLITKKIFTIPMFTKISNLLYVPISKDGEPKDWMFLKAVHIDLNEDKFSELKKQLELDYYTICDKLKSDIESEHGDGFIHTSNGKYIQIRSKDSRPYNPIYSNIYKKEISNKNHAFYFKKQFMEYITSI